MGICRSRFIAEQMAENQKIERQLKVEAKQRSLTERLLLLGTSGAGKSTILKQIRILHDNGFSEIEMHQRKAAVYSNTVRAMASILEVMEFSSIPFEFDHNQAQSHTVLETVRCGADGDPISNELSKALKMLWSDSAVRACFRNRVECRNLDSAAYFLDALDRIVEPDYQPSNQDILYSKAMTVGVVKHEFNAHDTKFCVIDVGGQRSQRKKWIHCFNDVTAVIFLSSVADYDQRDGDQHDSNHLLTSMRVFDEACNSVFLMQIAAIVFLNKIDIFAQKLADTSIRTVFPKYKGADNYDESLKFIARRFKALNRCPDRSMYVHLTCAVDTNQIKLILNSVIDSVIKISIATSGFE